MDVQTTPRETPTWAMVEVPDWVEPYLGRPGLGPPWTDKTGPLASGVAGIDRYHANHFVVYRPETADYLYSEYTPTTIDYPRGLLPSYENAVAPLLSEGGSQTELLERLMLGPVLELTPHPTVPPYGPRVPANRNLDDEALLASGSAWCNEQARVFTRMCQMAGIPARMIFLFFGNGKNGHTIAEAYADGQWIMADASWMVVFRDEAGTAMTAAECHNPANRERVQAIYRQRCEMLGLDDANDQAAYYGDLHTFGIMNYPLPTP